MRKTLIIALTFVAFIMSAFQANAQKVGQQSPQIQVFKWLNKEVKNEKPILLEFWATWCGPCKKAIPHLNELHDKYKNDVSFISMSIEREEVIRNFMKNTELKSAVCTDFERKTALSYNVQGIPHTVLIHKDGEIAWIGSPFTLTDSLMNVFVENNKSRTVRNDLVKTIDIKDLKFNLTVNKAKKPDAPGSLSDSYEGILFSSMSITNIMELILNASPMRIEAPNEFRTEKYDVLYKHEMVMPFPEFRHIMLQRVSDALNVKIDKSKNRTTVYKIRCKDCKKLQDQYRELSSRTNNYQSTFNEKDGKMHANTVNMSALISYLETAHKRIFINESGLNGFYSFAISKDNIEAAIKDLETYGLQIVSEEDEIDMYKLSPKK